MPAPASSSTAGESPPENRVSHINKRHPLCDASAPRVTTVLITTEAACGSAKYTSNCGQTLCRVDYSFDSQIEAAKGTRVMMARMPWAGYSFFRVADNQKGGIFYYARSGFDMPE